MKFVITVDIRDADYINQPHKPKTEEWIERVVEWAEAQDEPFTIGQCWKATHGHYQCVGQTIRSMANAGLIVQVNPGGKPKLWIRADKES